MELELVSKEPVLIVVFIVTSFRGGDKAVCVVIDKDREKSLLCFLPNHGTEQRRACSGLLDEQVRRPADFDDGAFNERKA